MKTLKILKTKRNMDINSIMPTYGNINNSTIYDCVLLSCHVRVSE